MGRGNTVNSMCVKPKKLFGDRVKEGSLHEKGAENQERQTGRKRVNGVEESHKLHVDGINWNDVQGNICNADNNICM